MRNSLYVALSAQVALEKRLDTIANNVANLNTVGFRADGVSFEQEVARAGDSRLAYVTPGTDYISRRAGALIQTGNPLDIAIQGDAWLGISTSRGAAYTRDGRMRMTETGALETLNGNPVLDAGGAPILLEPSAGAPTIASDGMITQKGRQVGAIGLFSLDPSAKLTRTENSGVMADREATPTLDFSRNKIVQGAVEGSNTNPIQEMVQLINVSRTFDSVSSQVTKTESSMQDAIKTLAG